MKIPDSDDHKDHRYRGLFLTWRAGLPPKIFTAKDICAQKLGQLADDAIQRRAWAHHQCHLVTGSMIIAAKIAWLALG